MYKCELENGPAWFNEKEGLIKSLTKGSHKKVRVICPSCKQEREAEYKTTFRVGNSYCHPCSKILNHKKKLLGQRFGRLLVIDFGKFYIVPSTGDRGLTCLCMCECGKEVTVRAHDLKSGKSTSCGCYQREKKSQRMSVRMLGSGNPSYRHDVTEEERRSNYWQRFSPKYSSWREAVFKRDDHTCQCCKGRGGKLIAHHMNGFANFPEQRFDVNNGLTLCESCHNKLHSVLGGKNKSCTRKQCERAILTLKKV